MLRNCMAKGASPETRNSVGGSSPATGSALGITMLPDLDLSSGSIRKDSSHLKVTAHGSNDASQGAHKHVISGFHARDGNLTDAQEIGEIFLTQTA